MDQLKQQAEALGITVDQRWSESTLRGKVAEAEALKQNNVTVVQTIKPAASDAKPNGAEMFPVRLLKHYKPSSRYEVIGEPAPPPYQGVGQVGKLWEGTVVRLPRDEAMRLINNESTVLNFTRAPNGELLRQERKVKFPLAERADAYQT